MERDKYRPEAHRNPLPHFNMHSGCPEFDTPARGPGKSNLAYLYNTGTEHAERHKRSCLKPCARPVRIRGEKYGPQPHPTGELPLYFW